MADVTACVSADAATALLNPLPNRWTLPLLLRVGSEPVGYGVAVHDQAVEHQCQVGVGNAPFAEEIGRALGKQRVAGGKEPVGRCPGCVRERLVARFQEYHFGRAFLPNRQEVAAQPGLNLPGPGTGAKRAWKNGAVAWAGEGLVKVLGDGRRFGKAEIAMPQHRHATGERS
jgi:hypothetical protein